MPPLISCLMATYNRVTSPVRALDESIYSFLVQTWSERELIIVNDTPGQTIGLAPHTCPDHSKIKIVNVPDRAPDFGTKMNMVAAHAQGDYLTVWDDDDVSLPWRLRMSFELLGGRDHVNVQGVWNLDTYGKLAYNPSSIIYPTAFFSRKLFDAVGRFPPAGSGPDRLFHEKIPAGRSNGILRLHWRAAFYIYRWDTRLHHLAHPDNGSYARLGNQPIQRGHFLIKPAWYQNYRDLTQVDRPALVPGHATAEQQNYDDRPTN